MNKNIFRCKDIISSKQWLRTYKAIIVNLLLWGCESWALKAEDRRHIKVFHHRSLRQMLNIMINDVMEQHISNEEARKRMDSYYSMEQTTELRCVRHSRIQGQRAQQDRFICPCPPCLTEKKHFQKF
jgi:hypothetical protein